MKNRTEIPMAHSSVHTPKLFVCTSQRTPRQKHQGNARAEVHKPVEGGSLDGGFGDGGRGASPGIGDVNVQTIEIRDIPGCDRQIMDLGSSGDKRIPQAYSPLLTTPPLYDCVHIQVVGPVVHLS